MFGASFKKSTGLADRWIVRVVLATLALIAALMILSTVFVKKVY